jgi:hypothetical protein
LGYFGKGRASVAAAAKMQRKPLHHKVFHHGIGLHTLKHPKRHIRGLPF